MPILQKTQIVTRAQTILKKDVVKPASLADASEIDYVEKGGSVNFTPGVHQCFSIRRTAQHISAFIRNLRILMGVIICFQNGGRTQPFKTCRS